MTGVLDDRERMVYARCAAVDAGDAESGQRDDRRGVRETVQAMHTAFSELRVEVLHCVGDGDLVATHEIFRSRHTGSWFGVPGAGPLSSIARQLAAFIRSSALC
jgi:predicted ester cyclase